LRLPDEITVRIDAYATTVGIKQRSEAVRSLILLARLGDTLRDRAQAHDTEAEEVGHAQGFSRRDVLGQRGDAHCLRRGDHIPPTFSKTPAWVQLVVIAGLAGNILYIVLYRDEKAQKSRIKTIIGLWFDAKERELRDRGGKS
jgi:hypothetical protein